MKSTKQNKKQITVVRKNQPSKALLADVKNWAMQSTLKLAKRQPKKQRNRMAGYKQPPLPQQVPFTTRTNGRRGMKKVQSKIVSFREELGAINGSSGFVNTAFTINPGQVASFPWLSTEAKQWEKYRIKKLRYEYTPQVTEFSTNGVGSVVIGFDSDASDPPPNDLLHALNVDPRVFDLPCKSICLDIPPAYMNTLTDGFFVRPGQLPGQSDIKTYDCGTMNISTIANVNSNQIGILAVEYVVEFLIPILEPSSGAPVNNSVLWFGDASGNLTTTVTYTALWSVHAINGIGGVNALGIITLPQGNYLVDASTFFTSGGANITAAQVELFKNAGSVTAAVYNIAVENIGTVQSFALPVAPCFVSSNGTDTVSLQVQATFGGGTVQADSFIRITAI